jgi:hypothetical protein
MPGGSGQTISFGGGNNIVVNNNGGTVNQGPKAPAKPAPAKPAPPRQVKKPVPKNSPVTLTVKTDIPVKVNGKLVKPGTTATFNN